MDNLLHLPEEFQAYQEEFQNRSFESYADLSRKGELILISLDGFSPVKQDYFIDAPIPDGKGGIYLLRVALPRFTPAPSEIEGMEIHLRQAVPEVTVPGETVEDVSAIAKKNLEDRIGRITAKAIARATAKYLAARQIRKKSDQNGNESGAGVLADFLTNLYSVVTEQSDKRSWRTLPGEIHLARIPLPPGTYDVELSYYGHSGVVLQNVEMKGVALSAGEKKFITYRMAR